MSRGMNNGRKLKIRRYSDLVEENKKLRAWQQRAYRLLRQVPPDRYWLSQFWIRDVKKLLAEAAQEDGSK
jgi:hypothetical protein